MPNDSSFSEMSRCSKMLLRLNCACVTFHATVPRVIIKTGFSTPDGIEEELAEYLCDTPGCPNIAVHVLGAVKGLGLFLAVCQEHLPSKQL